VNKEDAVKIDQTIKKNAGLITGAPARGTGKTAGTTETKASSSSGDSVTLSPEAQAMAAASDKDSFDVDKVNQIKAAIANGTFQVNANRIADGLIDTVKDLISTRNKG
jgi:negative regulator of flagellin synthesis FlgM